MPAVVQKIAIISSPTAAGYEDFMKQLNNNSFGYKFFTKLFPAVMQGEKTESSIIEALDNIFEYEDFFDLVVIIRGGGSRSDLMCFDNYDLAYFITQFPLPVVVGVGHEKDSSIIDLVSHTSLKTPTAVAEFLVSMLYDFENGLMSLLSEIYDCSFNIISSQKNMLDTLNLRLLPIAQDNLNRADKKLQLLSQNIKFNTQSLIAKYNQRLDNTQLKLQSKSKNLLQISENKLNVYGNKLEYQLAQYFKRQNKKLEYFEKSVEHLDPINILKKGYSISKVNGKIITDASEIATNEELETTLYKGNLKSKVL